MPNLKFVSACFPSGVFGKILGLRAEFAEKNAALLLSLRKVRVINPFSESSYSLLSVIKTSVGIFACTLP